MSSDALTWTRRPFAPAVMQGGEILGATSLHGRIVAVGQVYEMRPGRDFAYRPAAWTSDDHGATWHSAHRVRYDGSNSMLDVVLRGDSLVALGENGVLWLSADGEKWHLAYQRGPDVPRFGNLAAVGRGVLVSATPDGLLINRDARSWAFAAGTPTVPAQLVSTADGLVALFSSGGEPQSAYLSQDGIRWTPVPADGLSIPQESFETNGISGADVVLETGRGIAVAAEKNALGTTSVAAVWVYDPDRRIRQAPLRLRPQTCPVPGAADAASIIRLGPHRARRCLGGAEVHFRAWAPATDGICGCGAGGPWIASGRTVLVTAEQSVSSWVYGAEVLSLYLRPGSGPINLVNQWVEVVGHFDDPKAQDCAPRFHCRDHFAVDSLRIVANK